MNKPETWHFDKDQQHRLKRARLLKAAAECFNEKGFSGTSLKDVADKLGVTNAALYYYVRNKEQLVNLCYLKAMELAEDAMDRAIADGTTPVERIELFIRYQIGHVTGPQAPIAMLTEMPALKDEHRIPLVKRATAHQERLNALIQAGMDEGTLAVSSLVAASNVLFGAINWIPKWYRPGSTHSQEEIIDGFLQVLLNGLKSRD